MMKAGLKKPLLLVFVALILIIAFSAGCIGFVIGGSNLGIGGYPSFSQYKPSVPFSKEQYAVDTYRNEVESYINAAEEYIQNAENDIQRIQDAINEATRDVNSVVDEYNFFVSSFY